jgi:predicted metal-dependent enzyme (double-stranded beta helix superfamily)
MSTFARAPEGAHGIAPSSASTRDSTSTRNFEVWLICWSRLQDTGFHDHDGSRGAVAVVDGALAERRLAIGSVAPATAVFAEGSSFSFGAAHIHDVSQTGPVPATSIHAYSPRLGSMGF